MAYDDLSTIQTMCNRLEDFAASCEKALEAIEKGNEREARKLVDATRKQRSALGQAQMRTESIDLPHSREGIQLLRRMQIAMERVRIGDQAVREWISATAPAPTNEEELAKETPAQRVDRMLPAAFNADTDLAALVGGDLGPAAFELLRRGVKRVLVYLHEDDEMSADTYPDKARIVRSMRDLRAALVEYCAPPPKALAFTTGRDDKFDEEDWKEIAEALHTGVRWLNSNVITAEHLGNAWVTQGIENLPVLVRSPTIDRLDGAFKGKPMVIVSAGPSLDKNVHLLKELKNKAIICCISQAAKALDKAGVEPDIVIASDALDLSVHFDNVDVTKIGAMVLEATIHPNVFAVPAPRTFCYTGQSFIENWVAEAIESTGTTKNMRLSSGGSVSTTAFALAMRWQCTPVVMVGQDLALTDDRIYCGAGVDGGTKLVFSEDGDTFVMEGKKTLEHATKETISEEERVEWVDGYYGGTVKTSLGYSLFLRWFETVAPGAAEVARIINATEGGARIDGFEHIPLSQVVEEIGDASFDITGAMDDAALTPQEVVIRSRRISGEVEKALSILDRCVRQAHHCRKLATKIRKRAHARGKAEMAQLQAAERKLSALLKDVRFVSLLRLDQLHAARENALAAKTVFENLRAAQVIYDIVIEAGSELRPRLETSRLELKGMMQSTSDAAPAREEKAA